MGRNGWEVGEEIGVVWPQVKEMEVSTGIIRASLSSSIGTIVTARMVDFMIVCRVAFLIVTPSSTEMLD